MTREEFQQLSVEYALGSLHGEELSRFTQYLQSASPEERAEVSELVGTAALIPLSLEPKSPPPHVKQNLMDKIRLSVRAQDSVQQRQAPAGQRSTRFNRVAMISGISLALVLVAILVVSLLNTIEQRNQPLASADSKVRGLTTQITLLKDDLSRKEALLNILSSRKIEITVMNGLKVNPAGYGKVIWDPERKVALLQVTGLPVVAESKDYQLWLIKGKTPVSAGVFAVSDTAANFFRVERLAVTNPQEVSAFAVTLEPKGGVPAPSGDMYLAGTAKL